MNENSAYGLKKSIGGQCSVIKKGDEGGFGSPHSDRYCTQSVASLSLSPSMNEPFPFLAR